MVDGYGATRFTYTAAGQLLSEDGPLAYDAATYTYAQPTWENDLTKANHSRARTIFPSPPSEIGKLRFIQRLPNKRKGPPRCRDTMLELAIMLGFCA